MNWAPPAVRTTRSAVVMTVLQCLRCERLWLVAGDRRGDAGHPCPHCPDGAVTVVSAFADGHGREQRG